MEERTVDEIIDKFNMFKRLYKYVKYHIKEDFSKQHDEYELYNLSGEIDGVNIYFRDLYGVLKRKPINCALNSFCTNKIIVYDDWQDNYQIKFVFPDGQVIIDTYID
jgi:hypothetical protein